MDLTGITGVQYDSRRVRPGDCFVAIRGGATDGSLYIDLAIAQGAVAVVTDSREAFTCGQAAHPGVQFRFAEHGRRALAEIAAEFYGHPERALKVSAVTGTNGKTTTAFLLEEILQHAGRSCVLVGTIETHVAGLVRPSEHTTPEARDLLALFADGVQAGAIEAVMEMSSHALEQERVWGVPVDVAIWTNLTQDHLDYHGTMEAYFAAKRRIFAGVGAPPPRVAVVNADDAAGQRILADGLTPQIISYGIDAGAYRAERVELSAGRTCFHLLTPDGRFTVESPLTGRVNVYNLLAAGCAALARGVPIEQMIEAAATLGQVPGRFQVVPGSAEAGFTVVVDYAHTDDALTNLISLARDLAGPSARVITLFGCGGDRDRSKRPKMGRAAGRGSDLVVLTSDNPRTEDPAVILDEALAGVRETGARCIVEPDRAAAIQRAIVEAQPGDIVLIAGKGHEKVQILRTGTVLFDDVEVAARALRQRGAR